MKEKNGRRNNPGGGGKVDGSQNGGASGTSGDTIGGTIDHPIIGGNNLADSAFRGYSDNAVDKGLDMSWEVGCNPVENSMDASKHVEVSGQVNISKNEGLNNNLKSVDEVYYVEDNEQVVENLDKEKKWPEGGEEPGLCNDVVDKDKSEKYSNNHNCETPVAELGKASEVTGDHLSQSIIENFKGGVCRSSSGRGEHQVEEASSGLATGGITTGGIATGGIATGGIAPSENCMDIPPEERPQCLLQSSDAIKFKKRGNHKFIKGETNLKSANDEEKEEVVVSMENNANLQNPVGNIGMGKVGRKKGRQGKTTSNGKVDDGCTLRFTSAGCNVKEYNNGNSIGNGISHLGKSVVNKEGERKKGVLRKGKMKTKKKNSHKKKSKGTLKGNSTSGRVKYETTNTGNLKVKNEKKNYLKDEHSYNYNGDEKGDDFNSGACGGEVLHEVSNKFSNIKISKHFFLKMDDDDEEEEEEEEYDDGRSSRNSSMCLSLAKRNFQKKIIIVDEHANEWTDGTSHVGNTDHASSPSGGITTEETSPIGNKIENKITKRILTSEENTTLLNNVKEVNMKRFNFTHIISSKDSLMEQFMLYNLFSYDIAILKSSLKFIYTYCLFKNLRLYYQMQDKNVYIDEKAISNCRIKDNLIDTHSIILAMYENYYKHLNRSKIPLDDFFNLNYFNIHNVIFSKKNVQHNKNYDDSILPEKDNRKISSMYKFRPYLYSNCSNDERDSPEKVAPVDSEKKDTVDVENRECSVSLVEGSENKRRGVVKGGSEEEIPLEQSNSMNKDSMKECLEVFKDATPVTCKVEGAPCTSEDLPQERETMDGKVDSKVVTNENAKREEELCMQNVEEVNQVEELNQVEEVEADDDPLPMQKGRKRKMLMGESKDIVSDCTSKKQRGEEDDVVERAKDSSDVKCGGDVLLEDGRKNQVGSELIDGVLPIYQVKEKIPDVVECVENPKCDDASTVVVRVKNEEKQEKETEGMSNKCMMTTPPDGGNEEERMIVKSDQWEKEELVMADGRRKRLTQKCNESIKKGDMAERGKYKKKLMLRNRNAKEEKEMREMRLGRACKERGSSNVCMKRGRKNFFCNNNLSLMKNRRRRGGGISSMKTKKKTERTTRGGESHFKKNNSDDDDTDYEEDVSELENVNVMLLERIKNNYKRIMENNQLNKKKREEKMMLVNGHGGAFGRVDNWDENESGFAQGSINTHGKGGSRTDEQKDYTSYVNSNISGYQHAGVNEDGIVDRDKSGILEEGDTTTGMYKSNSNELWEREKKYMLSVDWLYNNNFNILDIKVNTHFSHNYHISLFFLCKYTSYNLFLHPINKNEHIVSSVILNSKNEVLTDNGNSFVLRYLLSFLSNKISSLRKCYANALYNSYLLQMPIRIFRHNNLKSKYSPNYGIRYDGIYKIVNAFTINDYSTSEYKRDILYVFKRLYVDKCFIPRSCRFYENQCERKKYLIEKNSVSINVFLDSEMVMTLTVPYLKNYKSTTFMNFNHIYKFIRRRCIKEKLASKWVRSDVHMYEMCKRRLRQEEALRRATIPEGVQTTYEVEKTKCESGKSTYHNAAPQRSTPTSSVGTGVRGAETFPFWCRGKYLPLVLVLETLNFEKEINENQRIRTKNFKNIEISIRKTEIPINCEMAKRPAHLFIPIKSKEAIAAHIELKKPFDDTWNPYEDLSAGKEKFKIPVENTVDDSLPPMNFTYVSKTLFFSRLPPYNLLPLCSGCAPQNYSKKEFDEIYINGYCKALRHKRTGKIYCDGNKSYDINDFNVLAACSGNCLCDPLKCTNKFPEGLHYPVKVVKTRDIGWDIVSASYIKANSLIMHYVGEITTRKEMISREHEYDKKGYFNYFIETAEVDETYTDDWKIPCIDALFISNVARFLNHSCEPNVNVITIWRGDKYPSVGIFASRDIKPDEPLKYHYGINYKNIKCMCNSKKCKGYIG
ncbi:SET domain protein, putative [Plasmodium knowlesi strain H]|uniref:SET domain protein, putative n=3 Tax=Plasmodium knowlesi TaxID=5850 RepID=A0A5K1TYY7_PLAKH|nr:SET domain protein, putative [Plasmodium knowlesi strain H]OTN67892.1 putative SET domain protein [Plasmodium knowlesi]CAA9990257.1 SET domain protein, putative [Plasmodium knowlesi strain H]SBO26785.1 SET domain protein, putative [Plasmodium knowlesi strain H]SBO28422.1 SET domain protein, putative [Plasmodium knowlesi strain H]VVS79731.1 SET domain protein, putative [Plasmodium knowlesi strain H]|eukprot:XP_002258044.1 SET domain, putative [Plasmodium knowlesi strain H]